MSKIRTSFKRILVVFKISYAMMSKRCLMTTDFEHGVVWDINVFYFIGVPPIDLLIILL